MPTINQTIQKIHNFRALPNGWHYGEGVPISEAQIELVEEFLREAESIGFDEANAFPGLNGQIELTFYGEGKTLGLMFEIDKTVSVTEETANEVLLDIYDQPYEVAQKSLQTLI